MRRFWWKVLGTLCAIAGIHLLTKMFDILPALPPERRLESFVWGSGLIGICFVSASLCFFPRSHWISLRILGGYGVAASIFNIVEGFRTRDYSKLGVTLFFWLPGSIYLIWSGKMTNSKSDR